ncbi:MAG: nitroreductase family protein [Saccharofermentanales bacterium]|jgi:nitroreductase|nr:nitroreductase family protein [Bacillota bacterium]NLB09195.1 nitroreductase family protein [Clostridiales bacterium]
MNETLITILDRSTTRSFTEQPLDDDQLAALKNAALAAPTARNRQENRFLFVTNKDLLERVNQKVLELLAAEDGQTSLNRMKERGARSVFYDAPLVVFIYSKASKYAYLNAGIAVQNLALAAHSLGLGSCINGLCTDALKTDVPGNLAAEMGLEPDDHCHIAIAIGHIAQDKEPHSFDYSHCRDIE